MPDVWLVVPPGPMAWMSRWAERPSAGERQKKDRTRAEADFEYELERGHKIEQDAFVEKKRRLERELSESGLLKEKQWSRRAP